MIINFQQEKSVSSEIEKSFFQDNDFSSAFFCNRAVDDKANSNIENIPVRTQNFPIHSAMTPPPPHSSIENNTRSFLEFIDDVSERVRWQKLHLY